MCQEANTELVEKGLDQHEQTSYFIQSYLPLFKT